LLLVVEFKFKFEFICLFPFSNLFKPFFLTPKPPFPSGPCFFAAHQLKVRRRTSFCSDWCTASQPSAAVRPSWPSKPPPPARSASSRLAADDRWGPPVIPNPALYPGRTQGRVRPAAARRLPCLAHTPRRPPPAYLSSAAPPGPLIRTLAASFCLRPSRRQNPSAAVAVPRRRRRFAVEELS
jgi:hypothetical protein